MLEAPSKEHLPAHSRDVCPWGATCPVHAQPTFADQKRPDTRHLPRRTLHKAIHGAKAKPCVHCGGARPEGLQLKKAGRSLRVCRACYDNRHVLFGVGAPRYLVNRAARTVAA